MTLSFFSCIFIIILLFLPMYILYNVGSTKQNRVFVALFKDGHWCSGCRLSDILCHEINKRLCQYPLISCGSIVSHLCCNIKETAP